MSVTDNSYFAYNQNDFIDLETALAEEETASIGYSSHNDYNRTFRLSFKNYDDNAVQSLRRSLVTPLSATSQEDPMYKTMDQNQSAYSPRVDKEPSFRARIAMSPSPSVADSLAHYNKFIDDSSEVDLVKSDLKDFMGSYSINEIMLRPDYLSPSPQSNHRYKKDALVTRHTPSLNSTIDRNSPEDTFSSPLDELKEERPRYRGSLLLELASKPIKSDPKESIVTKPIHRSSSKEINHHNNVSPTHRSVQTHLPHDSSVQKRSSSKEIVHHNNLSPTHRAVQTHLPQDSSVLQKRSPETKPIMSRYSQRHSSTNRTKSTEESTSSLTPLMSRYSTKTQDNATRPHYSQRQQDTTTESRAVTSRYSQRRSSNEDTNKTITSRYSQRRLSTEYSDIKPKVETKRYEPRHSTITTTPTKPRDLSTIPSRYSQRRLSAEHTMDTKTKIEHKRQSTLKEVPKPTPQPPRDIATITSRYSQRRLSNENTEIRNRTTSSRLEPVKTNISQRQSNRNSMVLMNEVIHETEPVETHRYPTRSRITTTAIEAEKYMPTIDTKHYQAATKRLSVRDRMYMTNSLNDSNDQSVQATAQQRVSSNLNRRVSFRLDEPSPRPLINKDKHIPSTTDKRASYHGGYGEQINNVKVTPSPRRPRSVSVPIQDEKHSLLPILSTRVRKYSNPKPETVHEEEIIPSRSKEKRPLINSQQLMSPSHSIEGSTSTDSTQSGDFDAGPATPPRYSYMEQQVRPNKPMNQSVSAVLLQVKQSRARTAAIINGMYK